MELSCIVLNVISPARGRMPVKRVASSSIPGNAGRTGGIMSLIRLAVQAHLDKSRLTIQELLEAAYYKRYGKPMPPDSLLEDIRRWEAGENNLPYLYDFTFGTTT